MADGEYVGVGEMAGDRWRVMFGDRRVHARGARCRRSHLKDPKLSSDSRVDGGRHRRLTPDLRRGAKPSLLLDLKAVRTTEIESLSATVRALGRRMGVSTPVHEAALEAVRWGWCCGSSEGAYF